MRQRGGRGRGGGGGGFELKITTLRVIETFNGIKPEKDANTSNPERSGKKKMYVIVTKLSPQSIVYILSFDSED